MRDGDIELQVKIADDVEVRVLKSTLMDVVSKPEPAKDGAKGAPANEQGTCLLYTSDAADERLCVDLGRRRIVKNKLSD